MEDTPLPSEVTMLMRHARARVICSISALTPAMLVGMGLTPPSGPIGSGPVEFDPVPAAIPRDTSDLWPLDELRRTVEGDPLYRLGVLNGADCELFGQITHVEFPRIAVLERIGN